MEQVEHFVTIENAENELIQILADLEDLTTRSGDHAKKRKTASKFSIGSPVGTRAGDEEVEPYVHIFNFEENKGFAIMSGDNRVSPLLAMTENGSLAPDEEIDNPGIVIFLANMEERYKKELVIQEEFEATIATERNRVVYGPYQTSYYASVNAGCPVQWRQRFPFNMYLTEINEESPLTGCVATAVVQLMAQYQYPSSYNGYYFNWTEMNKHWSTSYLNNRQDYPAAYPQIARIMQQMGLPHNLD